MVETYMNDRVTDKEIRKKLITLPTSCDKQYLRKYSEKIDLCINIDPAC